MKNIPIIPLHRIVSSYVKAKGLPFRTNRWEEFIRAFEHYKVHAAILN